MQPERPGLSKRGAPAGCDPLRYRHESAAGRPGHASAPNGTHVGFTQVRRDPSGAEALVAVVAGLDRSSITTRWSTRVCSARAARSTTSRVMGRGRSLPRSIAIRSEPESRYLILELGDGSLRARASTHPDADDGVAFSPDGTWFVAASARTEGLVETVSQIERSDAINHGLRTLLLHLHLNHRPALREPWLLDQHGARAGYLGQALDPGALDAGWDSRPPFGWHPDGRACSTGSRPWTRTRCRPHGSSSPTCPLAYRSPRRSCLRPRPRWPGPRRLPDTCRRRRPCRRRVRAGRWQPRRHLHGCQSEHTPARLYRLLR